MVPGYFSLWDAELFLEGIAHEPREAFWTAVKAGTDPLLAAKQSPLARSDTVGLSPVNLVRHVLEAGELRAIALRTDGELVSLRPAAWRRLFVRPDDPDRKEREPFHEAHFNRTIPIGVDAEGVPTSWGYAMIARADLARWCGAHPEHEPAERPDDPSDVRALRLPTAAAMGQTWHDVTLARDAVVGGWPPVGEVADTAVPILQPLALPDKARPPSIATLRNWYRAHVDNWPADKDPPSADTDLELARVPMPHVRRHTVRALRAELAPDVWTRKGRRKLGGKTRAEK